MINKFSQNIPRIILHFRHENSAENPPFAFQIDRVLLGKTFLCRVYSRIKELDPKPDDTFVTTDLDVQIRLSEDKTLFIRPRKGLPLSGTPNFINISIECGSKEKRLME